MCLLFGLQRYIISCVQVEGTELGSYSCVNNFKNIWFIVYIHYLIIYFSRNWLDKVSFEYILPLKPTYVSSCAVLFDSHPEAILPKASFNFSISPSLSCSVCSVDWFGFSFRWLCPGEPFLVSDFSAGHKVTMVPSCGWDQGSRWSQQLICQNRHSNGAGNVLFSFPC